MAQQVFCGHQFAYQQNKSTLYKLLCYNDWTRSRHAIIATDVVILDFCKAFDSLPHKRLLYKLKQYGIDSALLN